MQGYIKLHRRLWDNPISSKPNYLAVWLYVLSNANHKQKYTIINNEKILVERGQFIGSLRKISEHFSISIATVKRIIDYFEKEGMLNTKRTRYHTVFIVKNYSQYQVAEHQVNSSRTVSETTNNDNNDKNIYIIDYGVSEKVWKDFVLHRKKKKAEITETAMKEIIKQAEKAGWQLERALVEMCARGWTGFKAEWVNKQKGSNNENNQRSQRERARDAIMRGVSKSGNS